MSDRLSAEEQNYYVAIKGKMLRRFGMAAGIQREVLTHRFDERTVRRWMAQASEDLEALIPQIPYIGGGENEFTRYLLYPAGILPLARVMRYEGVPLRAIGRTIFDVSAAAYSAIPAPVRWWMGRSYFTEKRKARWCETAARSQERRYAGDWVCEFVEGDGETFVYGLNMAECGLLKFWRAQGLEELVPYLCLTDYALWRAIGVEVRRTQTLANGGSCCDYRYVGRGKDGPSGWPPEPLPEWTGKYESPLPSD